MRAQVVCNKGVRCFVLRFHSCGLFFFGSASAQIVTDPNAKTYGERLQELRARFQPRPTRRSRQTRFPAVRLSETQIGQAQGGGPQ